MSKKKLLVVLLMLMSLILTACVEDSEDMDSKLLSESELIEICNLSEEDYAGKDLKSFIEDFELTEENVADFNVPLLLEDYNDSKDYEYLFDEDYSHRTSDYTQDVKYIAFYENINTSARCMMIDASEHCMWSSEHEYIFRDVSNYERVEISEDSLQRMLEELEANGVFSLTSFDSDTAGSTDMQKIAFVIEYNDGTFFKIIRSGLMSEIAPEQYDEMVKILFME